MDWIRSKVLFGIDESPIIIDISIVNHDQTRWPFLNPVLVYPHPIAFFVPILKIFTIDVMQRSPPIGEL